MTQHDPASESLPSLWDVLPACAAGTGGVEVLSCGLDPLARLALAGLAEDDATRRLCAALAWVEARFVGASRVEAHLGDASGLRTATVPLQGDSPMRDALAAIASARPGPGGGDASLPWMVATGPVPPEPMPAASTWSLRPDAGGSVEVRFQPPMGREAASLLLAAVARVLPLVASDADARAAALDVLDPAERALQLGAWNDLSASGDGGETVHGRFARICAGSPEAVAVIDGAQSLTYLQLSRRADALARRLHMAGVRPGDIVALAMQRSADAVVAMLGVLKAGAAYLPLESRQPAERLAAMLEEARVRVVLVDAGCPAWPLPGHLDRLVANDRRAHVHALASRTEDIVSRRDSLAYVMYTSGSTGRPKGVEIRHAGILRLVCDAGYATLDAGTRMLHAAPLGFDAATLEVWGPLLNGGCVVVHADNPTGQSLQALIAREYVTGAWLTAALFNAIVDEDPAQLAGLEELLIGGEALSPRHVRRMLDAAPFLRLVNGYGPTECTTFACTHRIGEEDANGAAIPIGRPIGQTRALVLNALREPVPVGVAGELHLGGAGLARGYLGQPALTAQRFVASPFHDGERLYRTGDYARHRADGVLLFAGRIDGQVKIRGRRIETGEIEAVLTRDPTVRACAVVARDDGPGGKWLVAYVVPAGAGVDPARWRAHLAAMLPDYMVPAHFVVLDGLPLTRNGKLDRAALPAPATRRKEAAPAQAADGLEARLCDAFATMLQLGQVGRDENFFDLGGDSLLVLRLVDGLRRSEKGQGHAEITAAMVFSHPTPAQLAAVVAALAVDSATQPDAAATERGEGGQGAAGDDPIAIVAMAGRFPGAADVEEFWRNLCEGRDGISVFAPDALDPSIPLLERQDPHYVAARGVIEGVESFDAGFFGIGPREAELMDPQQRIFLELCWECMERAGHAPGGDVGVFAGMYNATYFQKHVAPRRDLVDRVGAFQVMLANEKDYIASRVAHKLDLTGPAVSVHTACSTSLVAIVQAMQALRAGQCGMALAGGVAVTCPPRSGYLHEEGSMLSPDGRTRPFDAGARGTVFSDGAAVVLLKPLSRAVADGNHVFAVLRGGAVNNDGASRASFTAPSAAGQAQVIARAHADAGIDARSVSYIEAHGTATPIGDPIEIEGLTRAFRASTGDAGFCRIGSLKGNVGHLVIAAGAAGVIKTALSLDTRTLPPSLYFEAPNPAIDFTGSPFVVNHALAPWTHGPGPRRAGVSAFGVGGTNAHVVLEQAPAAVVSDPAQGPQLLVLSARSPSALAAATSRLAGHLEAHPDTNLADVAWTLAAGRKAFGCRAAVACADTASAVAALRDPRTLSRAAMAGTPRPADVVFLFPGQGACYPGMGTALRAREPAFAEAFDACMAALPGSDLAERMRSDDPEALLPTAVMQPAIFAMEYALARWWMSRGVQPAAMLGHSIGEFVAAALAGVFSLPDAMRLVARRGALMQAQPPGSMLSVRMDAARLAERLPPGVSIAAENGVDALVVSGPQDAVASLQAWLERDGIACRPLRTSHAFHSAMMAPCMAPFEAEVAAIDRAPPRIPIASCVTADWLDDASAVSPAYWSRHLRDPVRFATALTCVLERQARVLLEVGPRATLSGLARRHPASVEHRIAAVASLADESGDEVLQLRQAAGQLWCLGVPVEPAGFDHRTRKSRLRLPTYPFERQRHWVEAVPPASSVVALVPQPNVAAATPQPEIAMTLTPAHPQPAVARPADRTPRLRAQAAGVLEDVAGIELASADPDASFIELGLDSLSLTQVALQLRKSFGVDVSFRQLMGECGSLGKLAGWLDARLPADAADVAEASLPVAPAMTAQGADPAPAPAPVPTAPPAPIMPLAMPLGADAAFGQQVIAQQMQLMSQQLALLASMAQGAPAASPASAPLGTATRAAAVPAAAPRPAPPEDRPAVPATPPACDAAQAAEEAAVAHTRYDVRKAFGAIARIDGEARIELDPAQHQSLAAFIARYVARTRKSRDYTTAHRPHMADPRVVNGFRPWLKEITYQIVVERSEGPYLHDIDGNRYIDALNGFGMSLFGWQPPFVMEAIQQQLRMGYAIGPQHPLAGEVARLVCEVTGHERAALCNTGSEAVLGALRIARTVTGRETVVLFSGAYHGIVDEMIVRGTRHLRAVPAAPGILRNTAEHVLVLDYGTEESMRIIRERAGEIAAVLVEPVQSRRPDFQPRAFLEELREVTRQAGALLVFDEVVTGFRAHPRGAQGLFGVQADLATYGKVVGGGYPIGVIAGARACMDALDGGQWQFGDDSVPTVGVTYFAGTFVRHPLALAAAHAVLLHLQAKGPALQEHLGARTAAMVDEMNAFCRASGAPIEVRTFASVWKLFFLEDHPLQDLLFAMMRDRGIHILDHFPCFLTTAHGAVDIAAIVDAFKASVSELQAARFLPGHAVEDAPAALPPRPAVAGARLGREPDGQPAWFVPNPEQPGKYMKVAR